MGTHQIYSVYLIQSAYMCVFMYISHNMKLWHELIQDIPLECIISSTHDNINTKIIQETCDLTWNVKMYTYNHKTPCCSILADL